MAGICSVANCMSPRIARRLCEKHYRRYLKYGDVTIVKIERHGMYGTPEYRSWLMMRNRCLNKNAMDYHHYGGRGITVCERWNKFSNFYLDMGERPEGTSIDRIDVNGNYEPGNCRWADKFTQAINIRPTSEHPGVNFKKSLGKYRAYIRRNNKSRHLGYFNTFDEALNARKRAEKEYI